MIVQVEEERKEVPIIKKTHKGEIEVTEEDDLSTLQVKQWLHLLWPLLEVITLGYFDLWPMPDEFGALYSVPCLYAL